MAGMLAQPSGGLLAVRPPGGLLGSQFYNMYPPNVVNEANPLASYDPRDQPGLLTHMYQAFIGSPLAHLRQADDALWGRYPMNVEDQRAFGGELAGMATGGAVMSPAIRGGLGMGIRAYHGSPHDFERFSSEHIGAGEGAQAYGHGLYFAEKEGVARNYRDNLSRSAQDKVNELIESMSDSMPANGVHLRSEIRGIMDYDPILKPYVNDGATIDDIAQAIEGRELGGAHSQYALDAFKRLDARFGEKKPGRMYEVNINAHPVDFLDWDKPLSEQGEVGKKAAAAIKEAIGPNNTYKSSSPVGNWFPTVSRNPAVSDKLRDAGIAGIRYKDAGSRGAEGGTSNYVVFDDKTIEILKKYGIAGLIGGGAAAMTTQRDHAAPGEVY